MTVHRKGLLQAYVNCLKRTRTTGNMKTETPHAWSIWYSHTNTPRMTHASKEEIFINLVKEKCHTALFFLSNILYLKGVSRAAKCWIIPSHNNIADSAHTPYPTSLRRKFDGYERLSPGIPALRRRSSLDRAYTAALKPDPHWWEPLQQYLTEGTGAIKCHSTIIVC